MASVNYISARGNRKSLLTFSNIIEELGIHDEIAKIKEKYNPILKAFGILDDLMEYQKLMIYLYIYNPEIFSNSAIIFKR